MDLSNHEIQKIIEEKNKSDKYWIRRNLREAEIQELFDSGQLKSLEILWHENIDDIDLSKQYHSLDKPLLEAGFDIIKNVDIELLFDKMLEGNPQLFREKRLFHEELSSSNIANIIDHWLRKEKLIPPTILLVENSTDLFPTDGKHRLNVAYYFGVTTIPIFVINPQKEKILEILKIT